MRPADIILLLLLMAGTTGLYLQFWQAPEAARWVEVRSGREDMARYSLWETREIRVSGRRGDSVLRIENGRIRFLDSPCRNRVCVHSGWHSHSGESAACVPNGVSIQLSGGGEPIDAIAF